MIFWTFCEKNSYELQNILKNSNFLTKGVKLYIQIGYLFVCFN